MNNFRRECSYEHLTRGAVDHAIAIMDSETWLDKATRLHRWLARPAGPDGAEEETAARERIKIALWLRREFSAGEPGNAAPTELPLPE